MFATEVEEQAYWSEICSVCEERGCPGDCIHTVPGAVKCPGCDGKGKIIFVRFGPLAISKNGPRVNLTTPCGNCEGVGLI